MPRREMRLASSVHGVALHLSGQYTQAMPQLEEALHLAEGAASCGLAHDQLVCVAGSLNDVGVNALAIGDHHRAAVCIKRAEYMVARAYRPSDAAVGALRVSFGLLHSVNGDQEAALACHRKAHRLLTSPASLQSRAPHVWIHSALSGAVGAALALHDLPSVHNFSNAAQDALRSSLKEEAANATHLQALADINTAICRVESVRLARSQEPTNGPFLDASSVRERNLDDAQGGIGSSLSNVDCRSTHSLNEAATKLAMAANILERTYGPNHAQTQAARADAELIARAATLNELPSPSWAKPAWLPAVGIGIALDGHLRGDEESERGRR
eukprot:scaffold35168_cov31-Tisochrysis_lutea.AAC.7